jgi:hypothetical protein
MNDKRKPFSYIYWIVGTRVVNPDTGPEAREKKKMTRKHVPVLLSKFFP